jgi:hypothetical protein
MGGWVPGARGAHRAGLGWAGMETHNAHDHLSETNSESKSKTRRGGRAIKHNIRQKKYASA